MGDEREYVLGTDAEELQRLRSQHTAWAEHARALWERAGIRPGAAVIDLGCGPGFTSFDLARFVGPEGRVIARDASARFLVFLEAERGRLGLDQVETSEGPVEELALPDASLDAAYARWLFCWLREPGAVLARVARAVRPGGVVVLQEYLDWAAMKLLPPSDVFRRAVDACMGSWAESGGTIDVGEHLPALAADCDLEVEHLRPIARLGGVGSPEWRWLGGFFRGYLPKLVEGGLLGREEHAAFLREWDERTRAGTSRVYAPTMLDAVLRKPASS